MGYVSETAGNTMRWNLRRECYLLLEDRVPGRVIWEQFGAKNSQLKISDLAMLLIYIVFIKVGTSHAFYMEQQQ